MHAKSFRELLVHLSFLRCRFAEQDGDHRRVMHAFQVLVDVGAHERVQEAEKTEGEQEASMVSLW